MPRKGVTVYLSPVLEAKLKKLARIEQRSESSVLAEAVQMKFAARLAPPNPEMIAKRYLKRFDIRLDKLVAEQIIQKELLLHFIRYWYGYNSDTRVDKKTANMEARFALFLEHVEAGLRIGGRSMVNVTPSDTEAPADDASSPAEEE